MRIRDIFKKRSFFPETSLPSFTGVFSPELNPTVAACGNKIANTLSVLPLQLYVHTKNGKRKATFNPLFRILENPAYEETSTLFYGTMVRHIIFNGNAYIYKMRAEGQLAGLSLVDPKKVKVTRDSSGKKIFNIEGKAYSSKEILHIPYPGTGYNGTLGKSPAETHRELIDLDNKLLDYINNYFDNSLGSRYALKPGASYNQKADLTKFYAQIMPAYNKFVLGNSNAGKVMIPPPDTELQKLDQPSNVEGELHSLLKMVEAQICLAFNVPPEIIDSTNQKYGSLEQKQNDFLSNCVQPLGDHICKCMETLLEDNWTHSFFIQYEYKNLLTTDTATTIDYLSKEVQSGLMSVNEARAKLGLPDIGEEGDFYWIPGNLIPQTMDTINAIMAKQKVALEDAHNPNGDDK